MKNKIDFNISNKLLEKTKEELIESLNNDTNMDEKLTILDKIKHIE